MRWTDYVYEVVRKKEARKQEVRVRSHVFDTPTGKDSRRS